MSLMRGDDVATTIYQALAPDRIKLMGLKGGKAISDDTDLSTWYGYSVLHPQSIIRPSYDQQKTLTRP